MLRRSITCRLNILLAERRLSVAEVHKQTGLSRTLLYLMQKDELQRIDLDSLTTLCNFFECEVSDMLALEKSE